MTDMENPYLPPQSVVQHPASALEQQERPYFTSGPLKFIVASLLTLNLYPVYWFYRNWKVIQVRTRTDAWPLGRAIFSVIWAYFCFDNLYETAKAKQVPAPVGAGVLAIIYIAACFAGRAGNVGLILNFFAFAPVAIANNVAISINESIGPDLNTNTGITPGLVAAMVLCLPINIGLLLKLHAFH